MKKRYGRRAAVTAVLAAALLSGCGRTAESAVAENSSDGLAFSQEWASVGSCHVSTYHRRLSSNEWMTSVPTMSRHVFPPANDDFTRGKSPLVGAINGLSDPKPDPIA